MPVTIAKNPPKIHRALSLSTPGMPPMFMPIIPVRNPKGGKIAAITDRM